MPIPVVDLPLDHPMRFLLFHLSICVTPIDSTPHFLKNLSEPSVEESSCLNIAGLVVGTCVVVIYLVADR